MPYINDSVRAELDPIIGDMHRALKGVGGEVGNLNYIFSVLLKEYVRVFGKSYKTLNDAVGVLECAKLELYRMFVAPYEDVKRIENGDIWS